MDTRQDKREPNWKNLPLSKGLVVSENNQFEFVEVLLIYNEQRGTKLRYTEIMKHDKIDNCTRLDFFARALADALYQKVNVTGITNTVIMNALNAWNQQPNQIKDAAQETDRGDKGASLHNNRNILCWRGKKKLQGDQAKTTFELLSIRTPCIFNDANKRNYWIKSENGLLLKTKSHRMNQNTQNSCNAIDYQMFTGTKEDMDAEMQKSDRGARWQDGKNVMLYTIQLKTKGMDMWGTSDGDGFVDTWIYLRPTKFTF